jgi:hypothetical protein
MEALNEDIVMQDESKESEIESEVVTGREGILIKRLKSAHCTALIMSYAFRRCEVTQKLNLLSKVGIYFALKNESQLDSMCVMEEKPLFILFKNVGSF